MKFPSMTNLTGVLLLSMSMPAHAGQDSKRNEPPSDLPLLAQLDRR